MYSAGNTTLEVVAFGTMLVLRMRSKMVTPPLLVLTREAPLYPLGVDGTSPCWLWANSIACCSRLLTPLKEPVPLVSASAVPAEVVVVALRGARITKNGSNPNVFGLMREVAVTSMNRVSANGKTCGYRGSTPLLPAAEDGRDTFESERCSGAGVVVVPEPVVATADGCRIGRVLCGGVVMADSGGEMVLPSAAASAALAEVEGGAKP